MPQHFPFFSSILILASTTKSFQLLPLVTPRHTVATTLHAIKKPTTTSRRRQLLSLPPLLLPLLLNNAPATAKTGSSESAQFATRATGRTKTVDPKTAFDNLSLARDELVKGRSLLRKDGVESLRDYFTSDDAGGLKVLEQSLLSILPSKLLSDEDRKAIGTIRTYGVAADALIMYGGLMSEIDEMNEEYYNVAAVNKFLNRAQDSIDEIILICRNNGF